MGVEPTHDALPDVLDQRGIQHTFEHIDAQLLEKLQSRDRLLHRSQADFLMAQSNLERLRTMLDYRQLRAPFAGVVVSRNYDPGVLVPATTTNTAASAVPVLVIAKVDTLRRLSTERAVQLSATLAIGDGSNDIPMLKIAGSPVTATATCAMIMAVQTRPRRSPSVPLACFKVSCARRPVACSAGSTPATTAASTVSMATYT